MDRWHGRTLRLLRFTIVAFLLVVGLAGYAAPAQADQASGASYTSPNYGYSIAWPMPWYELSESTAATYDTVVLADDQSSVQFSGGRMGSGSLQEDVEDTVQLYRADPTYSNVEQLSASDCPYQTDGYAACYRYDALLSDGSVVGATSLFEARDLGGGITLQMIAGVREPHLAEYLPKWASIVVAGPGEPVAVATAGADWEMTTIDGASYRIEPGVPALDRELSIAGFELARRTLRETGVSLDIDRLTFTVRATTSPHDLNQYGFAQNNSIFIYTASNSWAVISPIDRLHGLVHEFFHLYEFGRLEQVNTAPPAWFLEGAAETFAYLAVSQLGITDQMDFIRLALWRLGKDPVPGTLCSYVFDDSFVVQVYPLAYLAVQELLARSGQDLGALVRIFEDIAQGETFETAFANTFGVDLAQFCADVETWRTTLAPVDDVPPDLRTTTGQSLPSTVSLTSAPQHAAPGQQVLFTASTAPGANCQLMLTPGKRSGSITVETFANGSGEAFWLVIVPAESLPGVATVEVNCGGAAVQSELAIS